MTTDPRLLALQNIEVWEPVPGTSYEASNLGRLRNPKTGNFVGTCLLKNGYLSLPGMLSHRAILAAFDGPQPPGSLGATSTTTGATTRCPTSHGEPVRRTRRIPEPLAGGVPETVR